MKFWPRQGQNSRGGETTSRDHKRLISMDIVSLAKSSNKGSSKRKVHRLKGAVFSDKGLITDNWYSKCIKPSENDSIYSNPTQIQCVYSNPDFKLVEKHKIYSNPLKTYWKFSEEAEKSWKLQKRLQ